MAYVLAFHLDASAEKAVRQLWASVAEVTGSDKLLQSPAFPHITVAVFESERPEQIQRGARVIAEASGAQEVAFHSVGSFLSSEGVVYLAPVLDEGLLRLHQRLTECVGRWGKLGSFHYQPGRWVPHCTLGVGLSAEQVGLAVGRLLEQPVALRGQLARLVMADLDQLQVIWECELPVVGQKA